MLNNRLTPKKESLPHYKWAKLTLELRKTTSRAYVRLLKHPRTLNLACATVIGYSWCQLKKGALLHQAYVEEFFEGA